MNGKTTVKDLQQHLDIYDPTDWWVSVDLGVNAICLL